MITKDVYTTGLLCNPSYVLRSAFDSKHTSGVVARFYFFRVHFASVPTTGKKDWRQIHCETRPPLEVTFGRTSILVVEKYGGNCFLWRMANALIISLISQHQILASSAHILLKTCYIPMSLTYIRALLTFVSY